jgi:hypothetical protein
MSRHTSIDTASRKRRASFDDNDDFDECMRKYLELEARLNGDPMTASTTRESTGATSGDTGLQNSSSQWPEYTEATVASRLDNLTEYVQYDRNPLLGPDPQPDSTILGYPGVGDAAVYHGTLGHMPLTHGVVDNDRGSSLPSSSRNDRPLSAICSESQYDEQRPLAQTVPVCTPGKDSRIHTLDRQLQIPFNSHREIAHASQQSLPIPSTFGSLHSGISQDPRSFLSRLNGLSDTETVSSQPLIPSTHNMIASDGAQAVDRVLDSAWVKHQTTLDMEKFETYVQHTTYLERYWGNLPDSSYQGVH